jgi:hypothetical protein
MAEKTKYYAIIDYRASREDPAGLARRRTFEDGSFQDEALARDLSWQFTSIIVEWKRAESTDDLVEVPEDEANQIIDRFRSRWGTPD